MSASPTGTPAPFRPGDPPLYYDAHVFFCVNERPLDHPRGSCARGGAVDLRAYMKAQVAARRLRRVRINNAGCLDRCELGPVLVIYPDGVWYAPRSEADIDEIIDRHLLGGERVTRLLLTPGDGPAA